MIVTFKTDGTIEKTVEDDEGNPVKKTVQSSESVIPIFSDWIEFEQGFKLRHLFETMKRHPELQMINPFVSEYMDEYNSRKDDIVPSNQCEFSHIVVTPCMSIRYSDYDVDLNFNRQKKDDDSEYTESGKMKVYDARSIFKKKDREETKVVGDVDLHTYLNKYITKEEADQEPGCSYDRETGMYCMAYGMTFVDIIQIADLPISLLDGSLSITRDLKDSSLERYETYDCNECDVDIGGMSITNVYTVLDSIVTELCFHGGPSESQEVLNEIIARKDEIDEKGYEIIDDDNNDEE